MDNNKTIFQNSNSQDKENQQVADPLFYVANQGHDAQIAHPQQVLGQVQEPQVQVQAAAQNQQSVATAPVQNFNAPPAEKKSGRFSGKKKILSIFLSVFMVIALIAIIILVIYPGLSNNSTAGFGKVTLTYWGLFEESSTMQGIISDFEKQNPNIKIDYVKQDINQYKDRLITRVNNGTGPDIFRYHNTWYPMLSSVLLPLPTDTISSDQFNLVYYPVAQNDLIKNGAIYGIPLEIDTLSLFINNDLFQSAGLQRPVTWNDFINDARAMTVKDQNGKIQTAGAAMGTYSNIDHASDIISLLFLQNGVDFNNIQGTSSNVEDALTFYTNFVTDTNNVWDDTLDPSTLDFSKGNLGMYFGYSTDYFAIKQFNPNLSFQIVPVPQLPNQNVTLASYWVEGVSAKSTHQKEALLFMKFLAQKDTEIKLYQDESKIRDFGEPFARIDLADNLKQNPNAYTFVSQAPDAKSSFFVSSTNDNGINQQLNTYLENAVNSILGNTSVQDATQTFIEGVSPVLQSASR